MAHNSTDKELRAKRIFSLLQRCATDMVQLFSKNTYVSIQNEMQTKLKVFPIIQIHIFSDASIAGVLAPPTHFIYENYMISHRLQARQKQL